MPYLVILDGPDAGKRHICTGSVKIGRGVPCDVLVGTGDDSVSRFHASINLEDGHATFRDLSEQGSYVNGQHVFGASLELTDGDELRIGSTRMRFSFTDETVLPGRT
jgi:predicted component of type VI protein secretion system